MRDIRLSLEKEMLSWPNVTNKKMYGCPSYRYETKLFAFLVTDGIVLTKASGEERSVLSEIFSVRPFQPGKRMVIGWPQIALDESTDLSKVMPFIKSCYERAKLSSDRE